MSFSLTSKVDATIPSPVEDQAFLDEWDRQHTWHPFAQTSEMKHFPPLRITGGDGCWLHDADGNRYLDGYASTWTNVHGHGVPELRRVIVEQLDQIAHSTYLGLSHEPGTLLAKRLVDASPADLQRVFFSDNGSTSVEVALKMSLRYWQLKGKPERTTIVAMEGAYHGDTLGTMSLGADGPFTAPWRKWAFPVRRFKAPECHELAGETFISDDSESIEHLDRILGEENGGTAAVILEPSVQGAAGMLQQPTGFLRKVKALCLKHDAHLILDEVFVAFGRLGSIFVSEAQQICPDFLCLAKGLTGGYLPLAATLANEEVFDAFTGPFHEHKTFYHGHTYTANPLAASVSLKSFDLLQDKIHTSALDATISSFGSKVRDTFCDHPRISEVRQRGLAACLDLCPEKDTSFDPQRRFALEVCKEARARGLLLRPLGNSLPLVPPIAIDEKEISFLCSTALNAIEAVPL